MSTANSIAASFKALHQPGKPVLLANVWDIVSAQTVAALPSCKALASASFAVARANGVEDDDMTLETNLATVREIAKVAKAFEKPLTVDIQDGYGPRLEEAFKGLVDIGASGANLEDFDKEAQAMLDQSTAVSRIERALAVAKENGVSDFVLNARCDTLKHGGTLQDVLQRGHAYLDAGATTVFVLGKLSPGDVKELVQAFNGRVNIGYSPSAGDFTVKELAELGVARVSVGPSMQMLAMKTVKEEAEKIMTAVL